ncbi:MULTISPECIES: polysaccharide deacetylase family protein [unclassified Streptomyces]|uniref:polysaccharide deacetylase family protein n=1 Tax=unclassified Streptomyces TaxID=2593676 RepID=UPI0036A348FC
MKKDQMPMGRRAVLRLAAALGATATVGVLTADRFAPASSDRDPAPAPAGAPGGSGGAAGPAAGPRAGAARQLPSAYRLQPMTAYAPPAFRRAVPPVRRRPFLSLEGAGRSMVLTFDDGPDPRHTPAILSTLRRHDCRAMFFVCGEMAAAHPDLLRRIADDGHVVGNHSWSHPLVPKLRPSRIRAELGSTSDLVEQTLGTAPLWYRAPYGAWNRHSFEIGAELGMEPLGWTLDTLDWKEPGSGTIVRRVLAGAAPGVVVLSHDAGGDRSQSVSALRRYLPALLDAGYGITVPRR